MGAEVHASATLRAWSRRLLELLVGACAVSVLLRVPIAHLVGVPEHPWAAAAILPTGVLWMLLSLQRGALQGLHAYQPLGVSLIAEAALRIVFALILVGAGGGVTGAFLGTPIAFAAVALALGWLLHDRLRGGERERARAPAALADRPRVGPGARAAVPRRAAERRRDHGQAPARRRPRGLLRRGGGGGQGGAVGGDRRRPAPAAGGHAPRRAPAWIRGRCCCARSRCSAWSRCRRSCSSRRCRTCC